MSIGIGSSCSGSSCLHDQGRSIGGLSSYESRSEKAQTESYSESTTIAPVDPTVFTIEKAAQVGTSILVVQIRYPKCTNYEGRKILVYKGITKLELSSAKTLDPHFCDSCKISPIARFEPTERGWLWAVLCANELHKAI